MSKTHELRDCLSSDLPALESLYRDAFPEEDLVPLIRELLHGDQPILSLVAINDSGIIGHIVFTLCAVDPKVADVALLGPLCVSPACQKQGIGTALVKSGLAQLAAKKIGQVLVLGDPAYYGRFGFTPEVGIAAPYPIPEAWMGAWQSIQLHGETEPRTGKLTVPPPWRNPALWGA